MKKQYISPAIEQINFFAEEALMASSPNLRMDEERTSDVAWTQKDQGGWNSSNWNNLGGDGEE